MHAHACSARSQDAQAHDTPSRPAAQVSAQPRMMHFRAGQRRGRPTVSALLWAKTGRSRLCSTTPALQPCRASDLRCGSHPHSLPGACGVLWNPQATSMTPLSASSGMGACWGRPSVALAPLPLRPSRGCRVGGFKYCSNPADSIPTATAWDPERRLPVLLAVPAGAGYCYPLLPRVASHMPFPPFWPGQQALRRV